MDYAPVRGCMVIKPYGYALWEQMQAALESEGGQPPAQNGPAAAAEKGEEPSPPAAPAGDAPPGQDMPGEETGSEVRKDG